MGWTWIFYEVWTRIKFIVNDMTIKENILSKNER